MIKPPTRLSLGYRLHPYIISQICPAVGKLRRLHTLPDVLALYVPLPRGQPDRGTHFSVPFSIWIFRNPFLQMQAGVRSMISTSLQPSCLHTSSVHIYLFSPQDWTGNKYTHNRIAACTVALRKEVEQKNLLRGRGNAWFTLRLYCKYGPRHSLWLLYRRIPPSYCIFIPSQPRLNLHLEAFLI